CQSASVEGAARSCLATWRSAEGLGSLRVTTRLSSKTRWWGSSGSGVLSAKSTPQKRAPLVMASAREEIGTCRGLYARSRLAVQSCHLKLLMLREVLTATHGTRNASARIAPCIDSATTNSDCAIARMTDFASPRGST